jgi:hypothetical protein
LAQVIDIRGGILAITICLLIAWAADVPKPVQPQNAPLCLQSYYNKFGQLTAKQFVPCTDLIRLEIA